MQHDEVIWQVINQRFCSFKIKSDRQNFCKNEHNVTGLCNRSSCPLANSRYATIMEHEGQVYLYTKTIERAHMPNRMWEKRKLPNKYSDALALIDSQLQYWPNFLVHKCKQRLTKIHQYLIRMRRLALHSRTKLVTVNRKQEKREESREAKAEKAARLTNAIEAELIARLQAGTYEGSGMYVPPEIFKDALDKVGKEDEEGELAEEDEIEEEEENASVETFGDDVEFVEDFEEDEDDMEDFEFEGEEYDGSDMPEIMEGDEDDDEDDGDDDGIDFDDDDDEVEVAPAPAKKGGKKPAPKASKPAKPAPANRKRGRGQIEIEYEEERPLERARH